MKKSIVFTKNGTEAVKLQTMDPELAALIDMIGDYTLVLRTDYYKSLIRIIVGQQISVKAAKTIWGRFNSLCETINPASINVLEDDVIRETGISKPKLIYIKDLTQKILSEEINFKELENMEDEQVIRQLTRVKGVGRWTAEMFLIFSLGRLDVFSLNDVGLKRAIKSLYSLASIPVIEEIEELSNKWKPYRSVASLYLWSALDQKYIK
ncbi:MAG: DNA-3-methyladenine glycosylase 2 family protein [Firmicutes bacterium]|nr:DNA-3-methyladenine glycosylase 2 family protein [Bacillota bacterium]